MLTQDQRREFLIKELLSENPKYKDIEIPQNEANQRLLLRSLFNLRLPKEMSREFQEIQDDYLQEENKQRGIVDGDKFPDGISVWQGDITRLKVDAIVNAANSGMTGCYIPNHNCIDNAIHTYAGIELRNECAALMNQQGFPEPTAQAKITKAYNLPSKYIIHTVGPIVEGELTSTQESLLEQVYRKCLELADKYQLTSIAFPTISTGVFRFPKKIAAKIAVKTVKSYLKQSTNVKKVIFDVFEDEDKENYVKLLREN